MTPHEWILTGRDVPVRGFGVSDGKTRWAVAVDVMRCGRCGTIAARTGTGYKYRYDSAEAPEPVHEDCDVQAAREVMRE